VTVATAPTAGEVAISGRILTAEGRGITNATVTVSGGSLSAPITAVTGRAGAYTLAGLTAGETYVVTVASRRFAFDEPARVVTLNDNLTGLDFIGGAIR
jgi:glutamate synthase domain-containing protein 3